MDCRGHFSHFYTSWAIFGYPGVPRAVEIGKILIVKESSRFLVSYSIINKAGYTATLVACGWAGAVIEKVTGAFGQDQ